ncbi:MAG: phospho-N-acetylmuramoyl-pentapeptide-transferase [Planctomycetes bacterium]|nr:phospho-N-acetylmuramoyl-pentapeptide-transferase [Planctomycetota bacterium]
MLGTVQLELMLPWVAPVVGVWLFAVLGSVIAGRLVIPWLVKQKINDGENRKASEYLAMLHGTKKNTPTMGGAFIVPVILASLCLGIAIAAEFMVRFPLNLSFGLNKDEYSLILHQNRQQGMNVCVFAVLAGLVLLSNATLGFVDDYRKLKKLGKDGISGRAKLAVQTLIAVLACIGAVLAMGPEAFSLHLPFATLPLGWWMVPIGTFVIVGAGNAFNLSDGLDGLAGGTGSVAFLALGGCALLLCLLGQPGFAGVQMGTVITGFAASGALAGFLFWNKHPARVFMGDTGSLSLGALMGFIAVMSGLELILAVAGGVFVVEALSVMLQVGYFKATKGKRIFKCAPLHHHFQFSGWHETKVTRHFIGAAIACAMIALALSATMIRPSTPSAEPTATQTRVVPDAVVVSKP